MISLIVSLSNYKMYNDYYLNSSNSIKLKATHQTKRTLLIYQLNWKSKAYKNFTELTIKSKPTFIKKYKISTKNKCSISNKYSLLITKLNSYKNIQTLTWKIHINKNSKTLSTCLSPVIKPFLTKKSKSPTDSSNSMEMTQTCMGIKMSSSQLLNTHSSKKIYKNNLNSS